MNFTVVNLGCKVNKAESDTIAANLIAQGNQLAPLAEADTIIVNTCTVTGEAEKKTRKAVRRALRANERAHVLVTGCAAAIDPGFYQGLDPRVEVVSKAHWETSKVSLRIGGDFPLRVSLKVQDGCDHACTYCIVHVARGPARSRALDDIIAEARLLDTAGIREIMLSGIDLGSYRYEKGGLNALLTGLLAETQDARFRISSIEPGSIDDETIDIIARSDGRICRHLHIPLQSGSSRILDEMDRPYDADAFINLTELLYQAVPQLSLSTDIIVGFPGEKEQDHDATLDLARQARFTKIHAFRYSKRAGTPAAMRTDQIDPHIKEQRLQQLLQLGHDLRLQGAHERIGKTEAVLIEQEGIGMSESYYKVMAPPSIPAGSLVELSLTGVDSSCIMRACKKK